MGESNLLEGHVKSKEGQQLCVETKLGNLVVSGKAEVGSSVHLSLRPEQVTVGELAGDLKLGQAILETAHFLGTHYRCSFRHASGEKLGVRLPQTTLLKVGDKVQLSALARDVVVLTR
jgi:ABC-type Fe3+/spermidine/putrescine transport system ATPase subunit